MNEISIQQTACGDIWSMDTRLVIDRSLAMTMWERAEDWSVDRGGRFDPEPERLCLWRSCFAPPDAPEAPWSMPAAPPRRRSRNPIQGWIEIVWGVPDAGTATITKLEWRPEGGGSLEMLLDALNILAGECVVEMEEA